MGVGPMVIVMHAVAILAVAWLIYSIVVGIREFWKGE